MKDAKGNEIDRNPGKIKKSGKSRTGKKLFYLVKIRNWLYRGFSWIFKAKFKSCINYFLIVKIIKLIMNMLYEDELEKLII